MHGITLYIYTFIYSPAQEKLFELALPVLLTKAFEKVSRKSYSGKLFRIHHALFHYTLPHFIPCIYMHAIAQKRFLLLGKTLGTLEAL
jgi:hypothetical protein